MKGLFVSGRGGNAALQSSLHPTPGQEHPLVLTLTRAEADFKLLKRHLVTIHFILVAVIWQSVRAAMPKDAC